MIIGRSSRLTHFLEWREYKIVFKRYASLYFAACIEKDDNEKEKAMKQVVIDREIGACATTHTATMLR